MFFLRISKTICWFPGCYWPAFDLIFVLTFSCLPLKNQSPFNFEGFFQKVLSVFKLKSKFFCVCVTISYFLKYQNNFKTHTRNRMAAATPSRSTNNKSGEPNPSGTRYLVIEIIYFLNTIPKTSTKTPTKKFPCTLLFSHSHLICKLSLPPYKHYL